MTAPINYDQKQTSKHLKKTMGNQQQKIPTAFQRIATGVEVGVRDVSWDVRQSFQVCELWTYENKDKYLGFMKPSIRAYTRTHTE